MQRTGAAEGDQREVARVGAAALEGEAEIDRMFELTMRTIPAAASTGRGRGGRRPFPIATRARSGSIVIRAEHAARAERAEEQVRVGHRGLRPARP